MSEAMEKLPKEAQALLSKLFKQEGVVLASKATSALEHSFFPLSPSLNYAVGGKGIPYGRIVVKYGPQSGGKSLMAMEELAAIQRLDPTAWGVYVTTEYDADVQKLALYGVDLSRLIIRETNIPSEIFDWTETDLVALIDAGVNIKSLTIDTIKGIRGPKEMNMDSSEDHVMGDLSKYLNQAFRLILPAIRRKRIYTNLIQQVNEEFDQTKIKQGKKWNLPGGMALKHVADVVELIERVDSKDTKLFDPDIKMINDNPEQIGHRVRVKIEKNRIGPPDRTAEFDIMYNKGTVNRELEIALLAARLGVVQRPTDRNYIFGEQKWNSKQEYYDAVTGSNELAAKIYGEILKNA